MPALYSVNKVSVTYKPIISSHHGGKCLCNVQSSLAGMKLLPRNVQSPLLFVLCSSYCCPQTSIPWDYLTFMVIDKALKNRLVFYYSQVWSQSALMPIETGLVFQHSHK